MKRLGLIAALIVLALLGGAGLSFAFAQSSDGCPGGVNCFDASDFAATLDNWVSTGGVQVEWLNTDHAALDYAQGVLKVSGMSNAGDLPIHKTVYLQTGHYYLQFRASQEPSLNYSLYVTADVGGTTFGLCSDGLTSFGYRTITTCILDVATPGPVTFGIAAHGTAYFDYIYILQQGATEPTSTPNVYFATATPRPGTPIPPSAQATPQPTGTAFCDARPAALTGPGPYEVTATPSPNPTTAWYFLDTFHTFQFNPNWKAEGAVIMSQAVDHTGDQSYSTFVPYPGIGSSATSSATLPQALILSRSITAPAYVDGWAQADSVPIGATGYVQVWTYDGANWNRVDQIAISAQRWYPFHITVSASTQALAFVGNRSDDPVESSGGIYLDDLYVYGDLSLKPYCDNSYRSGVSDVNGYVNSNDGDSLLSIPVDKPCPGPINRPNNFWGYLMAGLTYFMDQIFAQAPYHQPGQFREMSRNLLLSPVLSMFTYLSILLDWSWPINALILAAIIQAIYLVIMLWKFARRATIE